MKDNTRLTPKNDILNALPADDLARLTPLLEHVDLPHGKVLYQPDVPIKHVYFPEHAMISVVAYTDDGQATEVAVIGGEGATGVSVVMGSNSTHYENIVQLPNGGWRIKTKDVREEFAKHLNGAAVGGRYMREHEAEMERTGNGAYLDRRKVWASGSGPGGAGGPLGAAAGGGGAAGGGP